MAKTTKSQARTKRERSEFLWGWLFILPTTIGLIVLNIIPIFQTIYQSFFKTGDFGKGNIFIGLQNYQKVFADKEIWQALINTFKYAIVEVPFSIVIALVLAVLLNRKMKGRSIYRTIIFLPMVAAPAAVAMVWRWLFNSDYGLINNVFHVHVNWVSNPKIAVFAVAIIGVWSIIGYNMVLFLAGLQEIPRDYYEAAEIDGANSWQKMFKITLPNLVPTMVIMFLLACGQIFRGDFGMFYNLTGNNPLLYNVTDIVDTFVYRSLYIYRAMAGNANLGYGAAAGLYQSVLCFATILLANFIVKKVQPDYTLF